MSDIEPIVVLNLRVRIGGSRSPSFPHMTRPRAEVAAAARYVRSERNQKTITTKPVERITRIGARNAKKGSPRSPRYAEVGSGRRAIKMEIKMRRGSSDLMNVARA